MYKRVLVATGGSPWSDAAVSYAIAWTACTGAELRIFLTVMTEKKKKLLFRYYDPRVLRPYLPSCTPAELQTFFGPIDQYVIEGEDPSQAHVHARDNKDFKATTVKLGAEA